MARQTRVTGSDILYGNGLRDSQSELDVTAGETIDDRYLRYKAGERRSHFTEGELAEFEFRDKYGDRGAATPAQIGESRRVSQLTEPPVDVFEVPEGFGDSRFDRRITHPWTELEDLNEFRARHQSGLEQLVNGTLKGVVLAGTTFVDGTLGLVAGVLNVAADAITGTYSKDERGETPLLAMLTDSFINNPVSNALRAVEDFSEKILPNYYTEEEQNMGLFRQMLTPNFWGDKAIKNLGFVVGAAWSGRVSGAALGRVAGLNKARALLSNAAKVSAAEGAALPNAAEIAAAWARGETEIAGQVLEKSLADAAKRVVVGESAVKVVGSFLAAVGEATTEAQRNLEETRETQTRNLQDAYARDLKMINERLDDVLFDYHPEWFDQTFSRDSDEEDRSEVGTPGQPRDRYDRRLRVKDEYSQAYELAAAEIYSSLDEKYEELASKLEDELLIKQNTNFYYQIPLLTLENFITLGTFMTGNYKAGRTVNSLVGIDKASKAVSKDATTALERGGKAAINKGQLARDYAKAIYTPFGEGAEEGGQHIINTFGERRLGAVMNYEHDRDRGDDTSPDMLLEFTRGKFDPDARDQYVGGLSGWMSDAWDAISHDVKDQAFWEEVLLGAVDSGLFGVPKVAVRTNPKTGKAVLNKDGTPKRKLQFSNELWDSVRDVTERRNEAKRVIADVNKIISQNGAYADMTDAIVRHIYFENEREKAEAEEDGLSHDKFRDMQLLSHLMTMRKAGRLDEYLQDVADYAGLPSDEIRRMVVDRTTGDGYFDRMTDDEVSSYVQEQAGHIRDMASRYSDVMGNLMTLYGGAYENFVQELAWKTIHFDMMGERFKEDYDAVVKALRDVTGGMAPSSADETGKGTFYAVSGRQALADLMANISGRNAADLLNVASSKEVQRALNELSEAADMSGVLKVQKDLAARIESLFGTYNERVATANQFKFLEQGREDGFVRIERELKENITNRVADSIAQTLMGREAGTSSIYRLQALLGRLSPEMRDSVLKTLSDDVRYKDVVSRLRGMEAMVVKYNNALRTLSTEDPGAEEVDELVKDLLTEQDTPETNIESAEEFLDALQSVIDEEQLSEDARKRIAKILEKLKSTRVSDSMGKADPTANGATASNGNAGAGARNGGTQTGTGTRADEGGAESGAEGNGSEEGGEPEAQNGPERSTGGKVRKEPSIRIFKDEKRMVRELEGLSDDDLDYVAGNGIIRAEGRLWNGKDLKALAKQVRDARRKEAQDNAAQKNAQQNAPENGNEGQDETEQDIEKDEQGYGDEEISRVIRARRNMFRRGVFPIWMLKYADVVTIMRNGEVDNGMLKAWAEADDATILRREQVTDAEHAELPGVIRDAAKEELRRRLSPELADTPVELNAVEKAMNFVERFIDDDEDTDRDAEEINQKNSVERAEDGRTKERALDINISENDNEKGTFYRSDMRGMGETEYDIETARDRTKIQNGSNDSAPRDSDGTYGGIVKALREASAYRFVDSGALGEMESDVYDAYRKGKLKNRHLEIQFVRSPLEALNGVTLLAVRLTESQARKYADVSNPIEVDGVRYQIVGALRGLSGNRASQAKYDAISARMDDLAKGVDGYFVAPFTTHITRMYSGKMVGSDTGAYHNLSDTQAFPKGSYVIGLVSNTGREIVLSRAGLRVKVPSMGIRFRKKGRAWLFVKDATGRYSPRFLRIRTLSDVGLADRGAAFSETEVGKRIIECLTIMADTGMTYERRMRAKRELGRYIYLDASNDLSFRRNQPGIFRQGARFSNLYRDEWIDLVRRNADSHERAVELAQDAYRHMFTATVPYRFNLDQSMLVKSQYVDAMVASGCFECDLKRASVINGGYYVAGVDFRSDGTVAVEESEAPVEMNPADGGGGRASGWSANGINWQTRQGSHSVNYTPVYSDGEIMWIESARYRQLGGTDEAALADGTQFETDAQLVAELNAIFVAVNKGKFEYSPLVDKMSGTFSKISYRYASHGLVEFERIDGDGNRVTFGVASENNVPTVLTGKDLTEMKKRITRDRNTKAKIEANKKMKEALGKKGRRAGPRTVNEGGEAAELPSAKEESGGERRTTSKDGVYTPSESSPRNRNDAAAEAYRASRDNPSASFDVEYGDTDFVRLRDMLNGNPADILRFAGEMNGKSGKVVFDLETVTAEDVVLWLHDNAGSMDIPDISELKDWQTTKGCLDNIIECR